MGTLGKILKASVLKLAECGMFWGKCHSLKDVEASNFIFEERIIGRVWSYLKDCRTSYPFNGHISDWEITKMMVH